MAVDCQYQFVREAIRLITFCTAIPLLAMRNREIRGYCNKMQTCAGSPRAVNKSLQQEQENRNTHTQARARAHVHTHAHAHTYAHAQTHTQMHIHLHTHTESEITQATVVSHINSLDLPAEETKGNTVRRSEGSRSSTKLQRTCVTAVITIPKYETIIAYNYDETILKNRGVHTSRE
jgi:hypothetical protein